MKDGGQKRGGDKEEQRSVCEASDAPAGGEEEGEPEAGERKPESGESEDAP